MQLKNEGREKVRLDGLPLEAETDGETWDLVQMRTGWEEIQSGQ